jgi:hypothetical protein
MTSQTTEDTAGLLQLCCFRAHLDGRALGYVEGVTEGRRQVQTESWELARTQSTAIETALAALPARRAATAAVLDQAWTTLQDTGELPADFTTQVLTAREADDARDAEHFVLDQLRNRVRLARATA